MLAIMADESSGHAPMVLAHGHPMPAAGGGGRVSGGLTVWLTGLPSSGKTTIATGLAALLAADGYPVEVLDGDVVRQTLGSDLGFSRDDRDRSVRRVGFVAELLSRHGVFAICALVSPYRSTRDEVRAAHCGRFFEVLVAAPLSVCSARDVKGLYARQRSGKLKGLTGVDDPYEPPIRPELVVPSHTQTVAESVQAVWLALPR